jgi:LysR family transcriptional regulator, regulator for bpeEF and oprC
MSSLRLLVVFSEAARQGSFAAAARELGLSSSAVVKGIARLELRLRVRLFHRTTRRVRLTQEGEALFERCRRILAEVEDLERAAANVSELATGVLRIDAPIIYGRQVILPVLARLASANPGLEIDLRLSDVYADVISSGLDAVVRACEIPDSHLIAHAFDSQHIGVYGSPAYFARRGRAKEPADLERHDCVRFRLPGTGRHRPWEFRRGEKEVSMEPQTRYSVNDGDGLVAAAVLGLGLVQLPHHIVASELDAGRLEEVLARFRPKDLPISLVYPANRHVPRRLLLLRDALIEMKRVHPKHRSQTEALPSAASKTPAFTSPR